MKTYNTKLSDFYCTQCGQKGIPLMRPDNKKRESGHLKRLYCVHCGKITNHCEVRPVGHYNYHDFQEEFKLGRFVNGQKVAIQDLLICSNEDCLYNKEGRCWNSNHSFDCGHRPKEDPIYESLISNDGAAGMREIDFY